MAGNSAQYNAAYYEANRDRLLEKMRQWKAANREKHRADAKAWHETNASRSKEIKAAYKARNPTKNAEANKRKTAESLASHAARQRARSAKARKPDEAVKALYLLSQSEDAIDCHWCLLPSLKGRRHVDHRLPLAKGGEHIAANLVIACATCNLQKGRMLPEQFAQRRTK